MFIRVCSANSFLSPWMLSLSVTWLIQRLIYAFLDEDRDDKCTYYDDLNRSKQNNYSHSGPRNNHHCCPWMHSDVCCDSVTHHACGLCFSHHMCSLPMCIVHDSVKHQGIWIKCADIFWWKPIRLNTALCHTQASKAGISLPMLCQPTMWTVCSKKDNSGFTMISFTST